MAQASTKHRNIIIASVIIIVLVISSVIALVEYSQLTASRISLFLSKYEIEAGQGSNPQIQTTVTLIGKAQNVALSSFSNSRGINCTFEPSMGNSNFTSMVTYAISDSTPTGKYPITMIASSDRQEINVTVVLSVLSASVTVSGKVGVIAPYNDLFHQNYSLNEMRFTDIKTGTVTSYTFVSQPNATSNVTENYSVVLLNKHTYNIDVYFKSGRDYYDNVLIYAPAGETAISKDFP